MNRSYRDLIAWQRAMTLAESVYRETADFPKSETYALTSQMRRAAVSVVSNIAEGQARRSRAEFRRFLLLSAGSLAELETQVLLSERLGYLAVDRQGSLLAEMTEIGRIINGLRNSLRADGQPPNH